MYPEVKQCLAAFEAAQEQYEKDWLAVAKTTDHSQSSDYKDCPRCAPMNTRDAAYAAAWDALKASASTPLVRWIAENCADEKSAALKALALLPAPLEDLDAFALHEGWCDTYGELRAAAEKAGVLPADPESEVVS